MANPNQITDQTIVKLSPVEIVHAEQRAIEHGEAQGLDVNYRGAALPTGLSQRVWRGGMLGEVAVAKYLGVEWAGVIGEDVGHYQVKTSDWGKTKRLCISTTTRPEHLHPDQIYIFVTAVDPVMDAFAIRGWARVRDIALDEHLDDLQSPERPLVWALPNGELQSIETLPANADAVVDWITPDGNRQRLLLIERKTNGYYAKAHAEEQAKRTGGQHD